MPPSRKTLAAASLMVLMCSFPCAGQQTSTAGGSAVAGSPLRRGFDDYLSAAVAQAISDSSAAGAGMASGKVAAEADTSFWRRPTGALFKSVIFPGWGQYANRKYQKAAVFFGLETFFIVKSVQYFKKTRDRYDAFQETKNRRDFFAYDDARKTRNKYYWFVAGTIFISMWDAYADAHLKPFEQTKDREGEFWGNYSREEPALTEPTLFLSVTVYSW